MAQTVLNHAKSYLGMVSGDKRHKELVNQYNAVKPYPVGYKMTQLDDWCAAFVTVIGDLVGVPNLIGRECGVQRFVQIFKHKKIWLGIVEPKPGDIIVFDWQKNGWADHIGFVESVNGNKVTTIEGNMSRKVGRRTIVYNDWRVAGYARPKYPGKVISSVSAVAQEVIQGKWGNGDERLRRLTSAGYNSAAVQKEVNRLLRSGGESGLQSLSDIARQVIHGQWGNGETRKKRLREAGYDYEAVQQLVNRMV